MLPELQSLAALASSRPDVVLKTGEPGCLWSFNWATCTITANPADLALRPPDYCRGLILHESAHAALTRVGDIVPRGQQVANLHPLLNVIEDCRIENWLQQRFPGCRPWIRLYNDRVLGTPPEEAAARLANDPAGGFLAGLLDHWWNGAVRLTLRHESRTAIAEVLPYFQQAVAAFPSPEVSDATRTRKSYESHPVSICYRAPDRESEPAPEECVIRMLQHRMWAITWQHIAPVFLRLLEHPDSEPTRQFIRQLALENSRVHGAHGGAEDRVSAIPGPSPAGPRSIPGNGGRPLADGHRNDYSRAVARHGHLIESCADSLLRLLTADSRPKRTRFHRSGHALDLRVAMQFEADPRQHERLWVRTTLPRRPDPAFVLLVDCSGSMQGAKAEATFAALVVLREVCLRLGIPLSIIAFNNQPRLLQSCDHPDAPAVPAKLAGLLNPDGGTHLSPALDLASRILGDSPHRHRHLWILSDGDTRDPDDARRKLRTLRRGSVLIHGLGLGPESEEISTLVPGAPVNLAPAQLPDTLAHLLRARVEKP